MVMIYDIESVVPFFSRSELDGMGNILSLDLPNFKFDEDYLADVIEYNGARPITRCILLPSGEKISIERFLNYSDLKRISDVALRSFNANVVWSAIEDRLNIYLLPFAALSGGDFLCFDYEAGFPPQIVYWRHDLSEEGSPSIEFVANSFRELKDGSSC